MRMHEDGIKKNVLAVLLSNPNGQIVQVIDPEPDPQNKSSVKIMTDWGIVFTHHDWLSPLPFKVDETIKPSMVLRKILQQEDPEVLFAIVWRKIETALRAIAPKDAK